MTQTDPRTGGRASSRDRILDAAAALVAEHGVHALTIDAAAAAAGLTKGGLIYHFKTRDDLLGALVERMVGAIEQRSRATAAGQGPRALLAALATDTFDMPEAEKPVLASLLAAASSHPHLLGPAQAMFGRIYGDCAVSGASAGRALVLAAALDGISLLELLNLHHFTQPQREAMRRAFDAMSRDLP